MTTRKLKIKNLGTMRSKKIKIKKWNKTRKYRGGVDTPTGSPKQKRQKTPTFKSVEDYNKRQEEIKEERSKRSVFHKVRDSMVDTVGSFLNPKRSRLDISLAEEPYVAHGVVGSVEEKKRKRRHDAEQKAKKKVRSLSRNSIAKSFLGDDPEFVQGLQAMMVIPPELREEVNAGEVLLINEVMTQAEWDYLAKECYIFSVRLHFYRHWKVSFLRNPDEELDEIFHIASLEWKKYVKININDNDDALLIFDRLFKHLIEKFERIIYKLFYRFRATLTPSDCFYAAAKIYQGMLKLNSLKRHMPGSNIILNTIKFFCDLTREIPSQIRCNRLEWQNLVYKYDIKEKYKNDIKMYRAFLFLEFYIGMDEDTEYEFDLESYHYDVVVNLKNIDEIIVKGGRPEIKPTRTSILALERNVDFLDPELEDLFKEQEEREYKEPYIQITSENEKFIRSFMPNLPDIPAVPVP